MLERFLLDFRSFLKRTSTERRRWFVERFYDRGVAAKIRATLNDRRRAELAAGQQLRDSAWSTFKAAAQKSARAGAFGRR